MEDPSIAFFQSKGVEFFHLPDSWIESNYYGAMRFKRNRLYIIPPVYTAVLWDLSNKEQWPFIDYIFKQISTCEPPHEFHNEMYESEPSIEEWESLLQQPHTSKDNFLVLRPEPGVEVLDATRERRVLQRQRYLGSGLKKSFQDYTCPHNLGEYTYTYSLPIFRPR